MGWNIYLRIVKKRDCKVAENDNLSRTTYSFIYPILLKPNALSNSPVEDQMYFPSDNFRNMIEELSEDPIDFKFIDEASTIKNRNEKSLCFDPKIAISSLSNIKKILKNNQKKFPLLYFFVEKETNRKMCSASLIIGNRYARLTAGFDKKWTMRSEPHGEKEVAEFDKRQEECGDDFKKHREILKQRYLQEDISNLKEVKGIENNGKEVIYLLKKCTVYEHYKDILNIWMNTCKKAITKGHFIQAIIVK